jgi:hypothetical protein
MTPLSRTTAVASEAPADLLSDWTVGGRPGESEEDAADEPAVAEPVAASQTAGESFDGDRLGDWFPPPAE